MWNKIKKLCQEFLLREDLRKPNALPDFGYRDVIICGDQFQLPPASGNPPIVTHKDFQTKCERCLLWRKFGFKKRNMAFGAVLDLIKRGGGITFSHLNAKEFEGEVDERVKQFFVKAYARGWNFTGDNVNIEEGVALTSYRKSRDMWCDAVMKQIERQYRYCETVDVHCYYSSPHGDTIMI